MNNNIWNLLNCAWFYLLALAYVMIFVNEITARATRMNKHINLIVITTGLVAFTIFNICLLTDNLASLWQTPVSAIILLSTIVINTITKKLHHDEDHRYNIRCIIYSFLLNAVVLSCVLRFLGI